MVNNTFWKFLDDSGTFVAKNPHKIRRVYFPLANEAGLFSSYFILYKTSLNK